MIINIRGLNLDEHVEKLVTMKLGFNVLIADDIDDAIKKEDVGNIVVLKDGIQSEKDHLKMLQYFDELRCIPRFIDVLITDNEHIEDTYTMVSPRPHSTLIHFIDEDIPFENNIKTALFNGNILAVIYEMHDYGSAVLANIYLMGGILPEPFSTSARSYIEEAMQILGYDDDEDRCIYTRSL